MQLGMIGLGRMGANIVRRLMANGHSAVVYDRAPSVVEALAAEGPVGAADLAGFRREAGEAARGLGHGSCGPGDREHRRRTREPA